MPIKAHHVPASRNAGRIGGLVAIALVCLISIALAICAAASASAQVGGALTTAVQQTTTHELASTSASTVERVAGAVPLPAPSPSPLPSSPAQAQAPPAPGPSVQQQAPAHIPARVPASDGSSPPPGESTAEVGAVVGAARAQIAPQSAPARNAGRGALRAVVDSASRVVSRSPTARTVAAVVQRASAVRSRTGEVVRALTDTVTDTTRRSQIVGALAGHLAALTTTITQATHLSGALEALVGQAITPLEPAPATQQALERLAGTHGSNSAQAQTLPSNTAVRTPSTSAQGVAERRAAVAAPFVQDSFGNWATAATRPSDKAAGRASGGKDAHLTQALPRGQSVASSPARGARPAPLPASPAPTPSPGGVYPAAAVGAGSGVSIALALVALLMLAAPLARRRLGLDGESWRLAPFVLVADRPG